VAPPVNVAVEGAAQQVTGYGVGGTNNNAGGWSFSEGTYKGEARGWLNGYADADGMTIAIVWGGPDIRQAGAFTNSASFANLSGGCGDGTVTVTGFGSVGHNTYLAGDTGGSTYGVATYGYGGERWGHTGGYCEPSIAGNGLATTWGSTSRGTLPNGVTSHAESISHAYSSGGGSLPTP